MGAHAGGGGVEDSSTRCTNSPEAYGYPYPDGSKAKYMTESFSALLSGFAAGLRGVVVFRCVASCCIRGYWGRLEAQTALPEITHGHAQATGSQC